MFLDILLFCVKSPLLYKYTHNTFFTTVYDSPHLQQVIRYVKVGVQKNLKKLFLSVGYSVFIGERCGIYLILFLTYIFISYHKISTRKKLGPTKNPGEKFLEPQNTDEKKFRTCEIPMTILDPQSTLEKKFWTNETGSRKIFGSPKYLQEKFWDSRNTLEKKFCLNLRCNISA